MNFTIHTEPLGKPRMTQRDRWKRRAPVTRYHAFKDAVRSSVAAHPEVRRALASGKVFALSWTAYLSMPSSWSKKKKASFAGAIHQQKPDRDNIDKALLDALFTEDSGVASGTIAKRWDDGKGARIEIEITTIDHE